MAINVYDSDCIGRSGSLQLAKYHLQNTATVPTLVREEVPLMATLLSVIEYPL